MKVLPAHVDREARWEAKTWGDDPNVRRLFQSTAHNLHSTRRRGKREVRVSGTVHLQLGLCPPPGETIVGLTEEWAKEVIGKLSRRSRGEDDVELKRLKDSLLAAPAVSS